MGELLANPSVRAALGGSLVWEELRGDFVAARAAVDGAATDETVFERILVDIVSGRTGAARRALGALGEQDDEARRVVHRKLTMFADTMHFNQVPGGAGASFDGVFDRWDRTGPAYQQPGGSLRLAGPASTFELRLMTLLATLQSNRSSLSVAGRRRVPETAQLLDAGLTVMHDIELDLEDAVPRPCSDTWVAIATADLHRRAGDTPSALTAVRAERVRSSERHDNHAVALCWLAEGDVLSCVSESLATLGLCIEASSQNDNYMDWRAEQLEMTRAAADDVASARQAYSAARQAFGAAGSVRGLAAVELREAALGVLSGASEAREHAESAESSFLTAGDERGRWLARVHGVLADVARTIQVEPARVREIGTWGAGDGCLGYAAGLGCMIARAGRRWLQRDAGYEQAVRCARLAEQLLDAAGLAVLAAQALGDQVFAHRTIGDRSAAITSLYAALDQLAAASSARPAAAGALAQRSVLLAAEGFRLATAARDPERMAQAAGRVAEAGAALDQGPEATGLRLLVDNVAQQAAALGPQYRAADLDDDPLASDRQREAAWAEATASVEATPEPQRWFQAALLKADRGDLAGAAEMGARYFDNDPFAQLAALMPKEMLAALGPQRINRAQLALTFFVRVRDGVRARAALDKLVTIDGDDWWTRASEPWLALSDIADLLRYEGSPEAVATYTKARDLLEQRGATLRDDSSKTAFADSLSAQRLFVHAARAALTVSPPDPARAFDFVERGKARALADLVSDVRGTATGDNDAIRAWREACARRELLRDLIAMERSRNDANAERIAQLAGQLASAEAEVPEREVAAMAQDRRRFEQLDARAKVASLLDVAAKLPAGVLAIEYAYVNGTLLAWSITRDGIGNTVCHDLELNQFRREALGFAHACASRSGSLATGETIAELLLAPFAASIRAAKQLVIIASQELTRVPFHALPFDGDVLLARLPVSYVPSAGLLDALAAPRVDGKPLLVVGDPIAMSIERPAGVVRPLPALPGAHREAEEIGKLVPGALVLTDKDATRAAVSEALPKHRVVQLATHGIVDSGSPWLSSIALANGEQLQVSDLMGIKLDADLVILSACESGVGEMTHGEEVLGLARGLLAAGTRATIVSLWPVFDLMTCVLMVELHRRLMEGVAPVAALQMAQLHVRGLDPAAASEELAARGMAKEKVEGLAGNRRHAVPLGQPAEAPDYRHPAYWAPFVLIGV